MQSEWQQTTWGELATLEYGKSLRGYSDTRGAYRVFGTNGPIGWHTEPLCQFPSVVIGRKGAYRGVHFSSEPFFVIDTAFYLKPKAKLSIKWAYYQLLTQDINGMDSGSAIPSTSRDEFYKLPVAVPPFDVQQEIAATLSALDDKITFLRETNATLEAIAQALFKSWFVDFDPVRAKMEGREPEGIPPEIAAQLPSEFENSELGEIPRGWQVEPLTEVFDFREGPGIRNWQYTNSGQGTRFINIRCIQDGDLFIETANRITDEEANGKYAHFHLQAWDIVVSTSGTLGRSAIVRNEHLPLMLNTSVIRFQPIKEKMRFSFVYEYLNSTEFLFKLESMASGSVQKNFGPMHLKQIQLVCPPIDLLAHYDSICRPLFETVVANRARIQTLATLRGTLLPRLMSGKQRVTS